jgi:hypothetical protein
VAGILSSQSMKGDMRCLADAGLNSNHVSPKRGGLWGCWDLKSALAPVGSQTHFCKANKLVVTRAFYSQKYNYPSDPRVEAPAGKLREGSFLFAAKQLEVVLKRIQHVCLYILVLMHSWSKLVSFQVIPL